MSDATKDGFTGMGEVIRIDEARAKMEFRPHSGIGNKVPISLMNGSSAPPPS